MQAAGGGLRRAVVAALALLAAMVPAAAVEPARIDRFTTLSDRFHARLPDSPLRGVPPAARRARAECLLQRFEDRFGAEGVAAVMELMAVLADGAEFDDPTIIRFNEAYGPVYDSVQRACTRQATRS